LRTQKCGLSEGAQIRPNFVKVVYRQTASDDVVRQFRYYLIDKNLPQIALRFRDAVRKTIDSLREHPPVGARYRSRKPKLQDLGSWPVAGLEAIRIYYLVDNEAIYVIRILHGKRDVKRIGAGKPNLAPERIPPARFASISSLTSATGKTTIPIERPPFG